jgi:large subunit ribosomal protein L15
MKLNEIKDNPGATRPRKRVGRGIGSGMGKTATRGHKGQKARSGGNPAIGFEGGQMPLHRRLPKRGFKNPFRLTYAVVNTGRLQQAIDAGKLDPSAPIGEVELQQAGLFRRRHDGVRLLAKGHLTATVALSVTGASKAAIAQVEKAGGQVTLSHPKAEAAAETVAGDAGAEA